MCMGNHGRIEGDDGEDPVAIPKLPVKQVMSKPSIKLRAPRLLGTQCMSNDGRRGGLGRTAPTFLAWMDGPPKEGGGLSAPRPA